VRGAVGALAGGAALGVANRLASGRSQRKIAGIRVRPPSLDMSKLTKHLDARQLARQVDVKRLGKNVDLKDLMRQLGDLAEQVEARSEDVRNLSAQARRLSRRLG
jgi:hypothetical protein